MITYVNGYVCTTPCEAAAAKKGHDPFAPPGTPPGQNGKTDKTQGVDGQPAVSFGGVLANLNQTNAVTPTGAASPSSQTGVQPSFGSSTVSFLV
jgi:hypothetical protein